MTGGKKPAGSEETRGITRLGLGTVQFGLDYGVSNTIGRTTPQEAQKIVTLAAEHGLRLIDTAHAYGASESILGSLLREDHAFRVVTKAGPLAGGGELALVQLEQAFHHSLSRLRQASVYGLLLHRPDDLFGPMANPLFDLLNRLKREGYVAKIGVSVYSAEQIDRVLEYFPVDIVQLPVSILDQRLLHTGHLERLNQAGIEVHARSVFLQGLMLMSVSDLPKPLARFAPRLERLHVHVASLGLTMVEAALGFVGGLKEVDHVICGVNTAAQLSELLSASQKPLLPADFASFAVDDCNLVDPSMWSRIR